ncbi:chemotaxis protein CheD [Oryzomonas rubra]|uniref:Probable chemoreceptor glutamine deamidase CheD n=1 Tax=Oryzomonas rubra TaxID=2509454 RepID=A0A5A9XPG9_9BACT|nr:chemotaxis protein CheD [Oryzomonas rubra]KAA0893949.1 chemotaxis protein CheD [Oryzomonas rubra]
MNKEESTNRHFLFPGTLFADARDYQISTVLGSCVSVCLWDTVTHVGGMNHFMLPLWNGEGLATPRYGNIAMEKLLHKMLALGCVKKHLVAKIFGGANVNGTGNGNEIFMIGDRNVILANQLLDEYAIPIKAWDVGGRLGRKIVMQTGTGVVWVGKHRVAAQAP